MGSLSHKLNKSSQQNIEQDLSSIIYLNNSTYQPLTYYKPYNNTPSNSTSTKPTSSHLADTVESKHNITKARHQQGVIKAERNSTVLNNNEKNENNTFFQNQDPTISEKVESRMIAWRVEEKLKEQLRLESEIKKQVEENREKLKTEPSYQEIKKQKDKIKEYEERFRIFIEEKNLIAKEVLRLCEERNIILNKIDQHVIEEERKEEELRMLILSSPIRYKIHLFGSFILEMSQLMISSFKAFEKTSAYASISEMSNEFSSQYLSLILKFYEDLPSILTESKCRIIEPIPSQTRLMTVNIFSIMVAIGTLASSRVYKRGFSSLIMIKNTLIAYALGSFILLPDVYLNKILQKREEKEMGPITKVIISEP